MKKFVASRYITSRIEEHEVSRETAMCVFTGSGKSERKHLKCSDYESWFDTWDEARAHLLSLAEAKVTAARRQLELAQAALGNVKGMKKPITD